MIRASGDASYSLKTSDGEPAPDRMTVTTIRPGNKIDIASNVGSKSGKNRVWDGTPEDNDFTNVFTFPNMSEYERAIISANDEYGRLADFEQSITIYR